MKRSDRCPYFFRICFASFFVLTLVQMGFAHAFSLGKTYDSMNWQEIEDIAPPFLVNWVKEGEFILISGSLQFDFEFEKAFLKESKENIDKFNMDKDGFIVAKGSRKQPDFIYGLPFPKIEAHDPKAGEKIMANFRYGQWRMEGLITPSRSFHLGEGGIERERISVFKSLFYQGRPGGPIHNRDNFSYQRRVHPSSLRT